MAFNAYIVHLQIAAGALPRHKIRIDGTEACMVATPLMPAAQYLRMSTEDQQYSIVNQRTRIQEYAESHGFTVIKTCEDPVKSGVIIKHRKGLRELLKDVLSGEARFRAILVYDVSRWGRFQNRDEAAHYEFLCAHSGILLLLR